MDVFHARSPARDVWEDMLPPICWYGSESSNGLAMMASRACLSGSVREMGGRVEMALQSMVSWHLI